MATVQKIREGIFLISWKSQNPAYYGRNVETNVNIDEISLSCQLLFSAKTGESPTNILEMDFSPIPDKKPVKNIQIQKPTSVLAIKCGVKQQLEFKNSIWTTEFFSKCECRQNGPITTKTNIDILIDFNLTSMKTESKRVLDHLLNLWETKTLADVTFKFNDKDVQAHAIIIASGSPVLAAMFQNDFKEKQERIVVIKDIKTTVFEKMLRFIYTGDADLGNVNVADLLIAANMYGVDSLKEECATYLAHNLCVSNAIHYLTISHLHESPKLEKSALEFISQNGEAIVSRKDWEELMKNYHALSLKAVKVMIITKK